MCLVLLHLSCPEYLRFWGIYCESIILGLHTRDHAVATMLLKIDLYLGFWQQWGPVTQNCNNEVPWKTMKNPLIFFFGGDFSGIRDDSKDSKMKLYWESLLGVLVFDVEIGFNSWSNIVVQVFSSPSEGLNSQCEVLANGRSPGPNEKLLWLQK